MTYLSGFDTFGSLYIANNSTAQTGIGTSFVTVDWAAGANGLFSNATPDYLNDKITVNVSGTYYVLLNISFSGSVSTIYTMAIALDGVEQDPTRMKRTIGSGGDVGNAGLHGLLNILGGQDVAISVLADGVSKSMTVQEAQFSLYQVAH